VENLPLSETAASFGGKPRIPSPRTTFVPVGHISLNTIPDEPGSYKVSKFYISWPLQRNGLGSAAMDTLESMEIREPLCAKTLKLGTTATIQPNDLEIWKAMKIGKSWVSSDCLYLNSFLTEICE
jgi:hypothetical protein